MLRQLDTYPNIPKYLSKLEISLISRFWHDTISISWKRIFDFYDYWLPAPYSHYFYIISKFKSPPSIFLKRKKEKKNCAPCDKSESELLQILYIAKFAEHFSQVCWCLLCRTLLLLLFFLVIHIYKITGYIMKACWSSRWIQIIKFSF